MKQIDKNAVNEITINKSKFIAKLIKVDNIDLINKEIENVKNEYKGATHYCYAYIIGNIKRFNDDGEPSGTAGMPILNILESNNLDNILCIVIRYFGGIKLGTGGLVRAYTNSIIECLKLTNIKDYELGYLIEINFEIKNANIINNNLKNIDIINKIFTDVVKYKILTNNIDIINNIKPYIIDYEILSKQFIETKKAVH